MRTSRGVRTVIAALLGCVPLAIVSLPAHAAAPAAPALPTISIPGSPVISGMAIPHWLPPVPGMPVLKGYGYPTTRYSAGHRGVDLRVIPEEPILAPAAGVVSFFGPTPGGISITVVAGLVKYTFQPVTPIPEDELDLLPGSPIFPGEPLALAPGFGHAGCVSCVHFGVRTVLGGDYVDPLIFYRHHEAELITPQ